MSIIPGQPNSVSIQGTVSSITGGQSVNIYPGPAGINTGVLNAAAGAINYFGSLSNTNLISVGASGSLSVSGAYKSNE